MALSKQDILNRFSDLSDKDVEIKDEKITITFSSYTFKGPEDMLNYDIEILSDSTARFFGMLKNWSSTLGESDKLHFLTRQEFIENINLLYFIFLWCPRK